MINLKLDVEVPVEKFVEKEGENGIDKVRDWDNYPLIISQQNRNDISQINLRKGDIKLNTTVKRDDLEDALSIAKQVSYKNNLSKLSTFFEVEIPTSETKETGEETSISFDYPLVVRIDDCGETEVRLVKRAIEDEEALDVFVIISDLREALEILRT